MHQRGPALVRIGLFCLLFGALVLALVEPSLAGTADSPEVQDPTGDVAVTGGLANRPAGVPLLGPADFPEVDIVKAYVQATNTTVTITLEMAGAPSTAATAKYNATFNITTGGANTTKSVQRLGETVTGPTGTTAQASGNLLNFTILSPFLGVVTGSTLTGLTISTAITKSTINVPNVPNVVTQDDQTGTDTAGPGTTAFVFNGPSPDDVDDDKIPDACEIQYFNDIATKSNASEDQDGDGLTLGQECALGTDPTKADSDGDGTNDKKDPFPTDATKGGTSGSNSGSNSGTRSGSASKSTTGSGSTSKSSTGNDAGEVKNFADAVEKLKSDTAYLGTSAGGLVAVLILAILALAVRWSL